MRVTYDNSAYKEAKSRLPKPDGKHCVICGRDLPKGQRKYCGKECWDDWYSKIAHPITWAEARQKAIERDNNTCRKCGKSNLQYNDQEVDHIIPVSMGGDNFDLKNLQTLCHECHVYKTTEDLARLREDTRFPTFVRDFYELLEKMEKKGLGGKDGLMEPKVLGFLT
jgi:predicted nucleic acid-binding Zn ribbon protein